MIAALYLNRKTKSRLGSDICKRHIIPFLVPDKNYFKLIKDKALEDLMFIRSNYQHMKCLESYFPEGQPSDYDFDNYDDYCKIRYWINDEAKTYKNCIADFYYIIRQLKCFIKNEKNIIEYFHEQYLIDEREYYYMLEKYNEDN